MAAGRPLAARLCAPSAEAAAPPRTRLLAKNARALLFPPKRLVQGHYYQDAVGIAFDLMSVNLADLPRLPSLVPALKLLFQEGDDEPEPMPHMLC